MLVYRDSTDYDAIPLAGLDGIFAYANGAFVMKGNQASRFIDVKVRHIDVNGTDWIAARILDVERYDATPAEAPAWIFRRNSFRGDATVYVGRTSVPALLDATSHLTEPWSIIVADWTGEPHIPVLDLPPNVKVVGCQWISNPGYDESCIDPGW